MDTPILPCKSNCSSVTCFTLSKLAHCIYPDVCFRFAEMQIYDCIDSNIISIYYRYNNGLPFVITSELGICFVVLSYIYSSPMTNQINANVDLEKLKCRVHSTCLKHVNLNIAGTYRKAALQPKTIFSLHQLNTSDWKEMSRFMFTLQI